MITKIFHPNVSTAGEICVNTLKKDWQPSYGIGHILVVVKCLLIHPNPESALDEEAGKLLLEDYSRFAEHAQMITTVHATPRVRAPNIFHFVLPEILFSDPAFRICFSFHSVSIDVSDKVANDFDTPAVEFHPFRYIFSSSPDIKLQPCRRRRERQLDGTNDGQVHTV
jgi:hypothetical protein